MDDSDLTRRLRDAGTQPVPPEVRDLHLRRMAAVATEPAGKRFGRLAVGAAAVVGFLAGSTGLAMAGALPDPAQDVAHDVLSVVQVDVPEGKRGPCVSAVAKSDLAKAEKKAAKDACPKGGSKGPKDLDDADDEDGSPGKAKVDRHADDPCKGKPPWAGRKDLSEEAKAAMKAERTATCGPDDDDDVDDVDGGEATETQVETDEEPEKDKAPKDKPAVPEKDKPDTDEAEKDVPAEDVPDEDVPVGDGATDETVPETPAG